jgi:NAD(P)-dependent dehydrogenase (short-subunit alcohol dehydrogenase family)
MTATRASQLRTYRDAVAIVTGGASGIGAALSRGLAHSGAHVVLADRQRGLAGEVAEAILAAGGKAEAAELDVRDADAVERLVAGVFERHGRLDYLFNNAGIGVGGEMRDYRLDDWRDVIDVNLLGVVYGVQAAYRRMIEQGFGHIVNTASTAGLLPAPLMGSYTATKHAVVGLSRALRVEAAHYGVRVTVVCPGVIRTPILSGGAFGRMTMSLDPAKQVALWEGLRPMDPDAFARTVLRRIAANPAILVVPKWWHAIWWLGRVAPWLVEGAAARAFGRMKKQITRV